MADDERVRLAERLTRIEAGLEGVESGQAELRAYLARALDELRLQADARQMQIDQLQIDVSRRAVQFDSTRLKLVAMEPRVRELEKLTPVVKAIMWVGAIVEASILALLWALITGQAQVVFK